MQSYVPCVSFRFISNIFAHSISGSVESYGLLFAPESVGQIHGRFFFAVFHISLNIVLFYFALDCNDIRRVGSRQRIGPNVWQELEPSLNVDVKT